MIRRCQHLGDQVSTKPCQTCPGTVRVKVFDCQHPQHDQTTLAECRKCPDFQDVDGSRQILNWSVGVTTAPRRTSTLEATLASLRDAGWPRPQLFAEPDCEIPAAWQHLPLTRRPDVRGAFPNWYLALTEMYMTDPKADAYFLCQDDVLFAAGLRDYLEHTLWPAAEVGVVSVYCPSHYAVDAPPGYHQENRGRKTWGALAYVFPNPTVRRFLGSPVPIKHRYLGPADGMTHIDVLVGEWCLLENLPYYVHSPSLAQHIGDTSTLWSSSNTGRRRARDFLEDINGLLVFSADALEKTDPAKADVMND